MSIWRNVLVYADARPESEVALAESMRLAAHTDGKALVLDVLHHLPTRFPPGLLAMAEVELLELMLEQRNEQLHEDVERLRLLGPVSVKVTHGTPAFELIRHAINGRHDLIVKAARGRDARHVTSFGTTALHLIRKSPVPVLIVSPDKRLLERPKVLCAVDVGDDEVRLKLNCELLAAARGLAEVYGADLQVVHVLDARKTGAYRAFLGAEAFGSFLHGWRRAIEKSLEQLLSQELMGVSSVRAQVIEGDPADVLVNLVAGEQVSHLVMGSVAHREPGLLIGSLAEDLLARVECSLLTIKPSGFETPVDLAAPQNQVA